MAGSVACHVDVTGMALSEEDGARTVRNVRVALNASVFSDMGPKPERRVPYPQRGDGFEAGLRFSC